MAYTSVYIEYQYKIGFIVKHCKLLYYSIQ